MDSDAIVYNIRSSGCLSIIYTLLHQERKEITDQGIRITGNLLLGVDEWTFNILQSSFLNHLVSCLYGAWKDDSSEVMWQLANIAASDKFELINTINVFKLWPFVSWAMKKRDHKLQLQALWVLDSGLQAVERGETLPCFTELSIFECLLKIVATGSKSSRSTKEFGKNIIERFLVVLDQELTPGINTPKKVENYRSTVDVMHKFVMDTEELSAASRDICTTLKELCDNCTST